MAERLANWLAREGQLTGEQRAVVAYGALTAVNTAVAILLMLAGGWLTGLMLTLLTAAATGGVFRVLTGGAHYSAPWRCSLGSSGIYSLLALAVRLLARFDPTPALLIAAGVASAGFGTFAILRYAPSDTKAYRLPAVKKRRLRNLALLLQAVALPAWLFGAWTGGSLPMLLATLSGYLWQLFTVTPAGFRVVGALDSILARVGVGGECT